MANKAILLSIKPQYCYLIANGEKTIEIRKTKPKLNPPFKCYMYQTLPKYGDWNERDGRVIGEFICDYISKLPPVGETVYCSEYKQSCLPANQIKEYAKGKQLYGWHISNLKIYNKPKELNEFKRYNRTEENSPCAHTKWLYEPCDKCKECNLKRPPQSWCYVDESVMKEAKEVLFRGRRIDKQEWVYGFYFCIHHNDDRNRIYHFIIPLDASLPKDKSIGEIQVEVVGTTVSQFTGVVDKNNDKIFCGDIIHIKYEYLSPFDDDEMCTMESIKKVVFVAGEYDAITAYGELTPMNYLPCDATEIIGNIYDNPEFFEMSK